MILPDVWSKQHQTCVERGDVTAVVNDIVLSKFLAELSQGRRMFQKVCLATSLEVGVKLLFW